MTLIQLRRGTAAAWTTANPILALGEVGIETDTGRSKCGDGSTVWVSRPYLRAVTHPSSITSAATVTPNCVVDDFTAVTALAVNLTLANPTGTAIDGQPHVVRIKDNGTSRTITYGSEWRALGVTLPSATTLGKTLYLFARRNAADSKWDVLDVKIQA